MDILSRSCLSGRGSDGDEDDARRKISKGSLDEVEKVDVGREGMIAQLTAHNSHAGEVNKYRSAHLQASVEWGRTQFEACPCTPQTQ
jgi:hypothetical protein